MRISDWSSDVCSSDLTAKRFDLRFTPDSSPEAGYFFRSDHFPFAKRGVPAVSFGSGEDMVDGGLAAGKAFSDEYRANRYHQPADEWEASWTFTGMARDLQLLYTVGSELANSERWRSEEHTSELQSLMRNSYAVFCLKKKYKDILSANDDVAR